MKSQLIMTENLKKVAIIDIDHKTVDEIIWLIDIQESLGRSVLFNVDLPDTHGHVTERSEGLKVLPQTQHLRNPSNYNLRG